MLIYDDIFYWDGFGGKLKLASGKCRLRIIDRKQSDERALTFVRPIIVVVSDIGDGNATVRSCAGNIATLVTGKFNLNHNRMFWVEYYEEKHYGKRIKKVIPEKFESVEFQWHDGKAIHPKWRPVPPPVIDIIKSEIDL